MGIVVVLVFYAVAFTVIATVGAGIFGTLTYALTKRSGKHRKATLVAALFPFLCVGFAGVCFVTYAVVNETIFHRDPGLGDSWETPLPNGYALMMIDTTDQGTVYNASSQAQYGISGVRQLQVSRNLILGARDSHYFERLGQESKSVDTYFELDTNQHKEVEFSSSDELQKLASSQGIALKLRDFDAVFRDYRTTWFDYSAGMILVVVPVLTFAWLTRWIWEIRNSQTT